MNKIVRLVAVLLIAVVLLVGTLATVGRVEAQSGINYSPFQAVRIWQVLKVHGSTDVDGAVTLKSTLDVDGDATLSGNLPGRSMLLRYQDVNATLTVYAAAEVATTTTSITTSLLGIDYPRNLVISLSSDAQRSAGNITVTGINARGQAATEIFAMTAITDAETLTGNVPWVSISSISIPSQTNPFTLTVTGGQKFGLPHLPQAAGDVYHLTVNATPQAAPTVNATYGTVDPVSTPAANVDYTILVRQ